MGIFDKLKRKPEVPSVAKADDVKAGDAKKPAASKAKAEKGEGTKKKATTKKSASAKAEKKTKVTKTAHQILLKPVVTEKSFMLQSSSNTFTFFVNVNANKIQVKQAVEELYGVKPSSIRIVTHPGKLTTRWGQVTGRRSATKKALVSFPKGTNVSVFEV